MTTDTNHDNELIRRFQQGDLPAFEQFIKRHQDRIYRLASVNAYATADAADITQEVFLRAFTGMTRFAFRAAPFTWLFKTTKNVCKEFNRKRRELPLPENAPEAAEYKTGETAMALDETIKKVRDIVARLPERQRDVVLLRVFEELSVEATAKAMHCRPGTVKALLHKALQRMRKTDGLSIEEMRGAGDDRT